MGKNDVASSIIFLKPAEYFHGVVAGAISSLNVVASEHAQSYLVNLLSHFMVADNFFPTHADGKPASTLTEQLGIALEETRPEQRALRLRQLGDFSLYVAGFFTDSLSRKLVDVDYYIGMGGAAYENVARLEEKRARAVLFEELGGKFSQFVDVLAQVSEETGFQPDNSQDLLRIYDLWAKTGSERLARQLAKAGIVPQLVKEKGEEDA